jgi:hypothetical protein
VVAQTEDQQVRASFIESFVEDMRHDTNVERRRWKENWEQFVHGTRFYDKEDWQSNFSLDTFQTRIRAGAGFARQIITNDPDFYSFDPINSDNERAGLLAPIWKKWVDFELRQAKFKVKMSTILLSSFINMGSLFVGWKTNFVKNPAWIEFHNKKERAKLNRGISDVVDNPPQTIEDLAAIESSVRDALDSLPDLISEDAVEEPEPKKYIGVQGLDLQIVDPRNRFWNDNFDKIQESRMNAMVTNMELWELRDLADKGVFDKDKVEQVTTRGKEERNRAAIIKNEERNKRSRNQRLKQDTVEVATYFGPLLDGENVIKEDWAGVTAGGVLLKEFPSYPFWEPPTHPQSPFVDCAVKEIPGRPTGAGAGDNAVRNAKHLDSNINLANDAMRFNVAGINVVDYLNLADSTVLESGGLAPGQIIETVGNPKDVFHHVNTSNNIEQQFSPIDQRISQAIDEQMGISQLSLGGPTTRSRVSATEQQIRAQGTERQVSNITIDLEQQLLVPLIEKVFARILQFGLEDLNSNIALRQVLSETEREVLSQLSDEDRFEILTSWYQVKITGFSSEVERQEQINDFNEVLAITNQNGTLAQVVNVQELFKEWLRLMKIRDVDKFVFPDTEIGVINRENQLLAQANGGQGKFVEVSESDDHELHLQSHGVLVNSPLRTQALIEHVQQHQQFLQATQQLQQQGAELNGTGGAGGQPGVTQ